VFYERWALLLRCTECGREANGRCSTGRTTVDVESDGAVVRQGTAKVAAYRDQAGVLHTRSAVCTHLGCVVHWNPSEKSWDCPCTVRGSTRRVEYSTARRANHYDPRRMKTKQALRSQMVILR
jgi:hypothetical protein